MISENRCKACGESLEEGWRRCPACQTEIVVVLSCPNCRTKMKPHWKECPACGAHAAPSASSFERPKPVTATGSRRTSERIQAETLSLDAIQREANPASYGDGPVMADECVRLWTDVVGDRQEAAKFLESFCRTRIDHWAYGTDRLLQEMIIRLRDDLQRREVAEDLALRYVRRCFYTMETNFDLAVQFWVSEFGPAVRIGESLEREASASKVVIDHDLNWNHSLWGVVSTALKIGAPRTAMLLLEAELQWYYEKGEERVSKWCDLATAFALHPDGADGRDRCLQRAEAFAGDDVVYWKEILDTWFDDIKERREGRACLARAEQTVREDERCDLGKYYAR